MIYNKDIVYTYSHLYTNHVKLTHDFSEQKSYHNKITKLYYGSSIISQIKVV